ncbi:MAG: LacI family transcriptional regulator [Paenibacillus sp.]|jgi:LacI family transcriptional regulator|nr:LacI family transcriptional regulator [Paenibacillus sp.]
MRKKKAVTLHDLSARSGLSVQTISKALRGLPGMSEESRERLVQLARELGYRTKGQELAHAVEHIPLRPSKPFRFKLVASEHFERFDMIRLILHGLQSKFAEYGHTVEIVQIPRELERPSTLADWAETYHIAYCDGLFIAPMIGFEQERFLLGCEVPRVLINFPGHAARVDSVAWDVGTAIHQSVRHLHANGHKRIMYVGKTGTFRGFVRRWQAFEAAMQEAGLDSDRDRQLITDDIAQPDWTQAFIAKVHEHQPTAVIHANSEASWVYHACARAGKQIPEQLSLIGLEHDQHPFFPELTRPILLIREAGVRAAERMLWRIANPAQPYEHVLLQGGFYEGTTVSRLL